ncbi:hypothetical protein SAMD00023353_8700130 [Rosellinia necatrix]|uniref:Uncharacterized protein n=1 Tax=Rosellinia necatrix TaxID=77044 RepID=A0A1S8AAV1_ROSNE|nr:hypothetical protein SAMD00023353_8700130 [Rosellinia necatrix]
MALEGSPTDRIMAPEADTQPGRAVVRHRPFLYTDSRHFVALDWMAILVEAPKSDLARPSQIKIYIAGKSG